MPNRFLQLLAEIERPAPPQRLFQAILERVAWERKALSLKRRVTVFGIATVILTAALAWTFSAVRAAMTGSGNLEFLSLAFSDTRLVLANWSAFAYSVFESLPAGLIAAFLAIAFLFMLSLRALIHDARRVYGGHHHAFNF